MPARALRRQILLSTTMIVGTLTGYGGRAYAACTPSGGSTYTCSDINGTQQNITVNNATVSTEAGFSVITPDPYGVNIDAYGDLSFTDANNSTLDAATAALRMNVKGDDGGTPGSITINTDGTLTGSEYGIAAYNAGTGAISITADGNVSATGLSSSGIMALNYGSNIIVATGTGTVHGNDSGVSASNKGTGYTTVTVMGYVYGYATGISAKNYADTTDLTVTTESGSKVRGDTAIYATNAGSGDLRITAGGELIGSTGTGTIDARLTGTGNGYITTNGAVSGGRGIYTKSGASSGAWTIEANGDVTGTSTQGIFIDANAGASVTTAYGASVYGGIDGIAGGTQSGALSITAHGDVTGNTGGGIDVSIASGTYGTNLSVTTGAGTTVSGGDTGILATNNGTGATTVTANGDITSGGNGILTQNYGTDSTVTIGAASTVTAADAGIFSQNSGSGVQRIEVHGAVNSTSANGINAFNINGTELDIVTGAGSNVIGAKAGIAALSTGSGATNITANGNVTGQDSDGIYVNGGPSTSIAVGRNSTVTANGDGYAIKSYSAPTSVTVSGVLNGAAGGAAGGAVQFDPEGGFADRLELHPSATINGNVLAGTGTDTLAFGGTGAGAFNLSNIDTGANTKQYRSFEVFEVDNGAWSFTGSTTAPFTVTGGTVMGTGTFGDLTVLGGTVAPGNSIGTMTVNGAFTLAAGAIFEVETNAAGQSDKVIVNGTVNLTGAILRVLAANGNYKPSTDYVIIDNDGADAVTGSFATVTSSLAFLVPTVVYNGGTGNDVVLTLERNTSDFCSVARTRNQCNVATALDQFPTTNALFLAVLNQTASGARQAFDALSGEIHATVAGTLADDSRYVREAVLGRLMQAGHAGQSLSAGGPQVASLDAQAYALGYDGKALVAPERQPLAFWTRAYGAWGDFNGDGNAATADRDLGGFVSGMDAAVSGSWRAGLATGASFANVDVDARYSSADVESYTLGGYLGGLAGSFALRGGGMWAWNDIDTSRAVIFPGFFERQKASYDADTGQIFGEVAYPTQIAGMAVEPFGGLAFVSIGTDSFRERGGALASLRGVDVDQDVGYSTLGLRAATTMQFGGMQIVPHVSAAWQHAFDDVTPGAALAFASTGIGFGIEGVPLAEDSALIDAGLDFALGANTTAGMSYTGQFGNGVTDNGVKGRFTWLF